jgi:hypothetical protein
MIPEWNQPYQNKSYDHLIPVGNYMMNQIRIRGAASGIESDKVYSNADQNKELNEVVVGYGTAKKKDITASMTVVDSVSGNRDQLTNQVDNSSVQIRKNFNETAFFFPELRTDSSGTIEFSFTIPEALTRWKFQALAFTKDLAFGYSSKEIVTQKQLMIQPNAPRFLREGDKMEFSAKIVNLTDKELTGQAELQLFDAATNESVSGWFRNSISHRSTIPV